MSLIHISNHILNFNTIIIIFQNKIVVKIRKKSTHTPFQAFHTILNNSIKTIKDKIKINPE